MDVSAGLDEEARSVVEALAVVRGPTGLGELGRLTDRSPAQLACPIDTLVRARLLVEVEPGFNPVYDLAHPLIRETVYAQLDEARRVALHRHAGRTVLVSGRLGEAAQHFARSATSGDGEAIAVLFDALAAAEQRGAYPEAMQLLGVLVDLMPAGELADLPR
jgi:hypothetical protein